MNEISLTMWDLVLGLATMFSFGIVVIQFFRQRVVKNSANAIYSQLWNIVSEIDRNRISDVHEAKRLINQVRISCIGMNKALGVKENVNQPYDYAIDEQRKKQRNDIQWQKEKSQLKEEIPGDN